MWIYAMFCSFLLVLTFWPRRNVLGPTGVNAAYESQDDDITLEMSINYYDDPQAN